MLRIFAFLILIIFTGCQFFQKEESGSRKHLARAYDDYLYEDELNGVVPVGTSKEDSITIVKNFIDNWSRQKALLYQAEKSLNDDKKDVEQELEEYRNSLITYAYETELIAKNLDTVVSDDEIMKFYKGHPQNFELKDNIIRVIYLKLNKKSPKIDKVRQWYMSESKRDRDLLEEYCHQYAMNYFLDDTTWLLFDDLLKEIPIKTYDQEQYLENNRNIEISDSTVIYFVSIKGFMIKNSMSPLSFERKNITALIINQRKRKLIEENERKIFETAKLNGDVEMVR